MGKIVGVCTSAKKGLKKKNVEKGVLIRNFGLEGDAHSGHWHRQLSLLANESVDKMRGQGLEVGCGDFAENITTEGLELYTLPIGARLRVGEKILLEVTQIGKECHQHCEIYKQIGDCVMPREGIFVRVLEGGEIQAGDDIRREDYITVGVLIASDTCAAGQRQDGCCPVIEESVQAVNGVVLDYDIVPDDRDTIRAVLQQWADDRYLDVIFVSGGTGFSPRDITPEAILDVVEKEVPGIPEAMRAASMKITPRAMLSRATAGIRGKCLIIGLPGSPKAVKENLEAILPALPHGLEIMRGITGNCAAPLKQV